MVTSHERQGVSNHPQHDCLFCILFRLTSKKTPKLCIIGPVRRIHLHQRPVDSLHKLPISNAKRVSMQLRHHVKGYVNSLWPSQESNTVIARKQYCYLGKTVLKKIDYMSFPGLRVLRYLLRLHFKHFPDGVVNNTSIHGESFQSMSNQYPSRACIIWIWKHVTNWGRDKMTSFAICIWHFHIHFLVWSYCSLIRVSSIFVPKVPVNNKPALVKIMADAGETISPYLNQWWPSLVADIDASFGTQNLVDCV